LLLSQSANVPKVVHNGWFWAERSTKWRKKTQRIAFLPK